MYLSLREQAHSHRLCGRQLHQGLTSGFMRAGFWTQLCTGVNTGLPT